jgi:nitrogen regulation protein NR(I)
MAARILLIEDDLSLAESLRQVLIGEGYTVIHAARGDDGLDQAGREGFDVILTDLRMPGLNGLDFVRRMHAAKPRLPIILMTAHGTTETAIEATRSGAYDYLLKPFEIEELLDLIAGAVATGRLMSEPVELGTANLTHDALVGRSRVMQTLYKEIGRVAARPVNVLIRGETGTGKELVARALYQYSDRSGAPFVAINCAAIPETLLESELFGHESGAFTGAVSRRIGRFEQADGGTVFLDEIGDMSPGTQVKLLRVLQEKCLQRLGGKDPISADVRVIAATHRNLEAAMKEKQFREDLYYRLSVVTLALPPLRERREDIPELVRYFLRKHGREFGDEQPSIHPDSLALLQSHAWPGNVRELENTVRKILLLARGFTIGPEHARAAIGGGAPFARTTDRTLREVARDLLAAAERGETDSVYAQVISAAERETLEQAMELAGGNQSRAARWLGISRLTLRTKLSQFGLHTVGEKTKS